MPSLLDKHDAAGQMEEFQVYISGSFANIYRIIEHNEAVCTAWKHILHHSQVQRVFVFTDGILSRKCLLHLILLQQLNVLCCSLPPEQK